MGYLAWGTATLAFTTGGNTATPEDNRNNHPHAAGRGWIVHNGQVLNYMVLVRQYGLVQRTECDSEVLGLLMARFRGSILQRARQAALAATGHLAILGIWRNPSAAVGRARRQAVALRADQARVLFRQPAGWVARQGLPCQ